jgi:hypothetical protein
MSRTVSHRTTARVLPVNGSREVLLLHGGDPVRSLADATGLHVDGLEPHERGPTDQAAWWTADALDADGSAANDQLTTMMRAAVSAVLGEA